MRAWLQTTQASSKGGSDSLRGVGIDPPSSPRPWECQAMAILGGRVPHPCAFLLAQGWEITNPKRKAHLLDSLP